MAIPKGLEPTGVILVDKPAGPSSFAVLAGVRSRTRAKTGHAGTLDPFATGLLILLSGRATTMASCFVGLPKRYLTDVDLSRRTTTGDPEGEPLEAHDVPTAESLEAALAGLRGEIELPIPTASAVKIGGERAYKLHRQGVVGRDAAPALAGRRARRHRVYRRASRHSICVSAPGRTSGRSPMRSEGTASRCGGRKSGRSPSRRPTPSAC